MNEAGKQFEFAVAYSKFWDRVENASDWAAAILVCGILGYLWWQLLLRMPV